MSIKRKLDESPSASSKYRSPGKWPPASKRFRREKPSVNTRYGQEGAFPGLDDANDGDEDKLDPLDLSTREALSYLRSVRSEANDIPHLLVAPKDDLHSENSSDGESDTRGFYDDGAYVAAPVLGPEPPSSRYAESTYPGSYDTDSIPASAQEAFTKRLLTLFHTQRKLVGALVDSNRTSSQNPSSQIGYSGFRRLVNEAPPTPRQLSLLNQQNVLKALNISTQLIKRYRAIHPRFSAWLLGLLCRLDGSGTLDADGVSTVRELGKKAVYIGIGFFNQALLPDNEEDDVDSADEFAASDNEDFLDFEDSDSKAPKREGNSSSPIPPEMSDVLEDESNIEVLDSTESFVASNKRDLPRAKVECSQLKPRGRKRNTSSPLPLDTSDAEDRKDIEALNAARERLLGSLSTKKSKPPNTLKPAKLSEDTMPDNSSAFSKTRCTIADVNTRATLDVLITIIGEVYGQRDLLEFRTVWPGENGLWG